MEKKCVLIYDDDVEILNVCKAILHTSNYRVETIQTCENIVSDILAFKPDIVFADVLLTKRNGYEVCQDLKNDVDTKDLPVVLMWSGFMEIDEAKIAQATARLEKPFDAEALRKQSHFLGHRSRTQKIDLHLSGRSHKTISLR